MSMFGWASAAEDLELIVNSTSLRLKPGDAVRVDASRAVGKEVVVYDIIANPPKAKLLALRRSATTIGCDAMPDEQMALVTDFMFGAHVDAS